MSLFKKEKTTLGVDIGTSSIKIVELGEEGGRRTLLNYALYELHGAGGRSDSARTVLELPDEEIINALRELIKTSGIKTRSTIASVSSFATFATTIELPYNTEEELAKAVPLEARKYVPVPLDQVVLDWSIIGPVRNPSEAQKEGGENTSQATPPGTLVEVFLAAVPKDETARYQRIMKAAGLNLVALELENSSLIRAVLGNDLAPTAILNIGGRSTGILIVSQGYERLSHNYEIGGYEMTNAIANALNINAEQAEALKRKYGLIESAENKVRSALTPLVDMMIFETTKTIESYERAKNIRVERVVIVGGLANMPGLIAHMKEHMKREVLIGNVFARLVYPQELTPLIETLSNTLAVAIGAAMRPT